MSRYIDVVETAKMLRAALKAEFPGTKFSVRSERFAGGTAININWTDGPTSDAVDAVGKRYQGATFNGMDDSTTYHSHLITTDDGAEEVRFGARFVQTQREISDGRMAEARRTLEEFMGRPVDNDEMLSVRPPHRFDEGEPEFASNAARAEYATYLIRAMAYARDYRKEAVR